MSDPTVIQALFFITVLIVSVVIHEVAHGYAALAQGDPTAKYQGRLTMNPLPHLDMLGSIILPGILIIAGTPILFGWAKPVPVNPYNLRDQKWGELKVALAGPLSNIAIAVVFGLFLRFAGGELVGATAAGLIVIIVLINLVLAVFNMIPVPPLDGSKVLFALLPRQYAQLQGYMERYGFLFLLLVILAFSSIISPVVFALFRLITGGGVF